MATTDYKRMHNEELIDLLFKQEDRVPRATIDELIARGDEVVPLLADIVMDRTLWLAELPDWWSVVHAVYALGAIGGEEVLIPLLAALRWSDAYDNEWVTEDLPSIFGSLGTSARPALTAVVKDKSAGWSARSIAMDALGSLAIRHTALEEEMMKLLGSILTDPSEEYGARRSTAYVLIDFRRADLREPLISLAKEELARHQQHPDYRPAFLPEDVERNLSLPPHSPEIYTRDWLSFYEPDQMCKRQERWAKEDSRDRADIQRSAQATAEGKTVIGRNTTCPCGSGKPYKRCCWGKIH